MISIETLETRGKIDVAFIDRDALKNEFYPFEVFQFQFMIHSTFFIKNIQIIAYKCNNDSSFISGSAALIVDDINDNAPEISFPDEKQIISINEETFATLFTSSELIVNDIDLAQHATYDIILMEKEDSRAEYSKAFNIVPNNGYQEQGFTISVADTSLIDFEEPLWREFDIVVS